MSLLKMRPTGRNRIGVERSDGRSLAVPPHPRLMLATQPFQCLGTGLPWRLRHPDKDHRDPATDFLGEATELIQVDAG